MIEEVDNPDNPNYSRWIDRSGDGEQEFDDKFWKPKENGPDAHYICLCGGFKFMIISTDSYETTGKCLDCGRRDVVHQG